jgi:hypothetical protein
VLKAVLDREGHAVDARPRPGRGEVDRHVLTDSLRENDSHDVDQLLLVNLGKPDFGASGFLAA